MPIELSDVDLLAGIANTEDNFIERKTVSDRDGWLKTAVAFANSLPIDYPGILYVGVDNGGTVQQHAGNPPNFEDLQKKVSQEISRAWPPIYHLSKTLRKDDREFLAVIITGSALRPHFTGKAYVRVGPETREASEAKHDELISQRSSKFRKLQSFVDREVVWGEISSLFPKRGVVVACNQFYLTVETLRDPRQRYSFSLDCITISYDHHNDSPLLCIPGE